MTIPTNRLIFIDFEACSLSEGSWPIEVGLAWIEDGTVQSWSSLIRPDLGWDPDAWSDDSAHIHGISRSMLNKAPLASDVALQVMDQLHGKLAVSDAPAFDHAWATRLTETVGIVPTTFVDFDSVLGALCQGDMARLNDVFAHLETIHTPHRAGPDAARLARAVLHGTTAGRTAP
ncbi:hypothetical protein AN189_06235 [Loktanella sp. 3ANDIMAR09]|uniref:3'-5' exonuclease n=1 Tax=Loktanella sp. 3ANDIMAR09 TaxID=1225657 RepID=UPI000707F313|nr:exonuclease domain-containing protein [Loktanella sp. 3ANDIMAR09]KQI69167.1 hypothetical protein AN189_06235 [Loktanella sp. 3ANDIMAR09]